MIETIVALPCVTPTVPAYQAQQASGVMALTNPTTIPSMPMDRAQAGLSITIATTTTKTAGSG